MKYEIGPPDDMIELDMIARDDEDQKDNDDDDKSYHSRWWNVQPHGINEITFDCFPQNSWGYWIPSRNEDWHFKNMCIRNGIVGYKGSLEFYWDDLVECHYEYGNVRNGHNRGEGSLDTWNLPLNKEQDDSEEAYGIWELKDGRFVLIYVTFHITDWFYHTSYLYHLVADSMVNLIRFGISDLQRRLLEVHLLDREGWKKEIQSILIPCLAEIILDYIEDYTIPEKDDSVDDSN